MRTITLESKRAVRSTCVLVWLVVFILTCPIFRFAQTGFVARGDIPGEGGGPWGNGTGLSADGEEKEEGGAQGYVNCWDDAIDQEFADYVPYGMVLHLLGFFVPFIIIAWCYSQVVRTIFRTLRSPPSSMGGYEDGVVGDGGLGSGSDAARERTSVSISGSQHSHYIRRRRKSIKTIVTITLLFALCFLPFHVTRTLFLLLRRGQVGSCNTMKAVSICYKVTRPLASCNAWLNALLYFLTGDKGPPCCSAKGPRGAGPRHRPSVGPRHGADRRNGTLWWPLKILKREGAGGEEEPEGEERPERETIWGVPSTCGLQATNARGCPGVAQSLRLEVQASAIGAESMPEVQASAVGALSSLESFARGPSASGSTGPFSLEVHSSAWGPQWLLDVHVFASWLQSLPEVQESAEGPLSLLKVQASAVGPFSSFEVQASASGPQGPQGRCSEGQPPGHS
ncbi:hypothetical protein CRUP_000154 [Coryphaenoides rupestris]|nr:hypothetical protein CRUP_000154 [Coryphaenoides rupestris]